MYLRNNLNIISELIFTISSLLITINLILNVKILKSYINHLSNTKILNKNKVFIFFYFYAIATFSLFCFKTIFLGFIFLCIEKIFSIYFVYVFLKIQLKIVRLKEILELLYKEKNVPSKLYINEMKRNNLRLLRKLHLDVKILYDRIAQSVRFAITIMVFASRINVLIHLHFFIEKRDMIALIYSLATFLIMFVMILSIENIKIENDAIKKMLFLIDENRLKKDEKYELMMFRIQILKLKFCFCPYQLYNFDLTLYNNIITTTFTYLVVLRQLC